MRLPALAEDPVAGLDDRRADVLEPRPVAGVEEVLGQPPEDPAVVLVVRGREREAPRAVEHTLVVAEAAQERLGSLVPHPDLQPLPGVVGQAALVQLLVDHARLVAAVAVRRRADRRVDQRRLARHGRIADLDVGQMRPVQRVELGHRRVQLGAALALVPPERRELRPRERRSSGPAAGRARPGSRGSRTGSSGPARTSRRRASSRVNVSPEPSARPVIGVSTRARRTLRSFQVPWISSPSIESGSRGEFGTSQSLSDPLRRSWP